jgi:hypothetical protein
MIENCRVDDCRKRELVAALQEAEHFIAYFSGETDGVFVGPGTPAAWLENTRRLLNDMRKLAP